MRHVKGINKDFDIEASLTHALKSGFSRDDYKTFAGRLENTNSIVIIGDNSGEIVFDRLLAEELTSLGKKVKYIVKGGPVLNDATMEDAVQAGMHETADVLTTGSNYLGVPLHRISPATKKLLETSDLIISKGQANFESLESEEPARGRVFFLLKIKCPCVARVAGAKLGEVVFFTR